MTTATWLKVMRWMRETDQNQGDVAARLGVDRSAFSRMLRNKMPIGLELAVDLSVLSGIPASELVTDKTTLRKLKDYLGRHKSDRRSSKDSANVA